jgi:hypothetical protein
MYFLPNMSKNVSHQRLANEREDVEELNLFHLEKELSKKVEVNGVEPMTLCLQSRCSSQLSYTPDLFFGFASQLILN